MRYDAVIEMTSGPHHGVANRVRALQASLNQPGVPASTLATEALHIFQAAGDSILQGWLNFELGGYPELDTQALHNVLGVPLDHRLVAHVTGYRTQRGVDATPGRVPIEFRHFFIEPLSALEATRNKVAASAGGSTVLLDFGPHPRDADYPTAGEFTRGVFDRVVTGFRAALHLQLGALAT